MSNLVVFTNDKIGAIRVTTIDGEPWFVGKDVAEKLGYSNTRDALLKHVDGDDKGMSQIATPSGEQSMIVINESGLYSLILSSHLPTARDFKRWITSEVLPSVRRYGLYATPERTEQILHNPDFLIRVLTEIKELRKKNEQLIDQNKNQIRLIQSMEPKAAYYDAVVNAGNCTSFRVTAKEFGIGERTFIRFLEERGYCYRNAKGKLLPYADKLEKKLFVVREVTYGKPDDRKTSPYTMVTPKGRAYLYNAMRDYAGV